MAYVAESQEWDAAISNAAIAGINAADVLIIVDSGIVGHGPEHESAVKSLRSLNYVNEANQLARLLRIKNVAQYGERRCTAIEARDAITRAERLTNSARRRFDKE